MLYTLYKITNVLNQSFYIGVHKTLFLNDDYMGSGKLIKRAIKKHGKENFKKEILELFDTEEAMLKREEEIVTFDFIESHKVYNLMPGGGYGSKDKNGLTFEGRNHTSESKEKIGKSSKNRNFSIESRKKMSDNNFAKRDPDRHREIVRRKRGKMTESHRKNLSDSIKLKMKEKDYVSPNKGLKRAKIKCPFCEKEGAKSTMKRWHFDNCKNNVLSFNG